MQEAILDLPPTINGRDAITERQRRRMVWSQIHRLQCGYPASPPSVGDYLTVADPLPTPSPGQGYCYVTAVSYQGQTRYGGRRMNGVLSGRDPAVLAGVLAGSRAHEGSVHGDAMTVSLFSIAYSEEVLEQSGNNQFDSPSGSPVIEGLPGPGAYASR